MVKSMELVYKGEHYQIFKHENGRFETCTLPIFGYKVEHRNGVMHNTFDEAMRNLQQREQFYCVDNKKRDKQCIFFHGLDECKCNNEPDDYGECIYEDGIESKNVNLKCKHYKPLKEVSNGQDTPSVVTAIPENWQNALEKLSFQNKRNTCRKQAYICSPCRADTAEGVSINMKAARLYMYFAHTELNMNAGAPHAYLPIILCDKIPAERALAMKFCVSLIETGGTILVCGNRITSGMKEEISHAARIGMEILVFNGLLYTDVQKLVTKAGADKKLVILKEHPILELSPEEIISMPEVS